jgi:hypothetical protein
MSETGIAPSEARLGSGERIRLVGDGIEAIGAVDDAAQGTSRLETT